MNSTTSIDYFKIGRADEIREIGFMKIRIRGWEIAIIANGSEFLAVELANNENQTLKAYLPDDWSYPLSGGRNPVGRLLKGPACAAWGRLQYFPVRIEDNFVLIGLAR
jgi:hypothetical protein